jgi:hypothetical protein
MIMGTSGRYSSGSTHDHEKGAVAVSDGETTRGAVPQTARQPERLWQTDSVTFGRIIIGWRVGT